MSIFWTGEPENDETFDVTAPGVPARIRIVADPDPASPREWHNLGTMYCEHRRYRLGDTDAIDPRTLDPRSIACQLSLYLYDHSGITMRASDGGNPFHCPWDSGCVGVIYVTRATVRAEYGWARLTAARRAKLAEYLRAEVAVYDQFLTGDVYGFVVEDTAGETIDSCWGFYGSDWRTNGMREHWDAATVALAEAGKVSS